MTDEKRELVAVARYEPGTVVLHAGKPKIITSIPGFGKLLLEDPTTGERKLVTSLADIAPWSGDPNSLPKPEREILLLPPERIQEGERRREVIEGIIRLRYCTRAVVIEAGKQLGLSAARLYELIAVYRKTGSFVSLIPHGNVPAARARRLTPIVEALIEKGIDEVYATYQKPRPQDVVVLVQGWAKRAGEAIPSGNTVRHRIRSRDRRSIMAKREGRKAAQVYAPVLGSFDKPLWPLQRVQIDSTLADFFIVDEALRLFERHYPFRAVPVDPSRRRIVSRPKAFRSAHLP